MDFLYCQPASLIQRPLRSWLQDVPESRSGGGQALECLGRFTAVLSAPAPHEASVTSSPCHWGVARTPAWRSPRRPGSACAVTVTSKEPPHRVVAADASAAARINGPSPCRALYPHCRTYRAGEPAGPGCRAGHTSTRTWPAYTM